MTTKMQNADTLNALVEMQESPAYAVRRTVLVDAERIIVSQENKIFRLESENAELLAALREISEANYASPERLREMATQALKP